VVALSPLRLARLKRGLTLEEVSFRTRGRLNPGRLSRLERGYVQPNEEERRLLQEIIGVSSDVIDSIGAVA
jgi:transcriptional regulator with XRE-family HTH domain